MNLYNTLQKLKDTLLVVALTLCFALVAYATMPTATPTQAAPHQLSAAQVDFVVRQVMTRSQAITSQKLADATSLYIQYIVSTASNTATIGYQVSNNNSDWLTHTTIAAGVTSGTNLYTVPIVSMYQRFMVGLSNTGNLTVSLIGMVK